MKISESEKHTSRLSERAGRIRPAQTLAIAAKATEMRKNGIDVVSFSTGEPDFNTPDIVSRAGIDAIESGFTHYTDATGIPALREAVARKFASENDLPATDKSVLISAGGKHSIFNALMAIVDPGDEVIVPAPYWVSYPEMVSLLGGKPVVIQTDAATRYKISVEQLRASLSSKTKVMILNTPSNPTGMMYTPQELVEIGNVLAEHEIFVVADELYEKITYGTVDHFSIGSMPELQQLAITVNGVSKAWAMTGWRIGFMHGPQDVIEAAGAIQSQTTSNPCSISQKAALAALTDGAGEVDGLRERFAGRRDLMDSLLSQVPGISYEKPDGAFYYYVDASSLRSDQFPDSLSLAEYVLKEHRVAYVPGAAFGNDAGFRLSFACSEEEIEKGLTRIASAFRQLPQSFS